jgi:hypothetical protein
MPGEHHVKFMLRIPNAMRERIATEAEANGRSLNAEIAARLAKSLDDDQRLDNLAALIERIETTIRRVEKHVGG